jgi:putative endopeptidase
MAEYPTDPTVRPQDDFFGHVNNSWLSANPIPSTESSWGTFYELRDQSTLAVKAIMDELLSADVTQLDHDQTLLHDFFKSGLQFNELASQHHASIKAQHDAIDAISSKSELAGYLGHMHGQDQSAFWTLYVDHDDKNSKMQVLRIHQSGLSMPNRDYYIDRSAHMKSIRKKYEQFHQELRGHLGALVPGEWDVIYALEHTLAKAAWTNVKLRDIEKNYNRTTLNELRENYDLDWDQYFKGLGWKNPSDNIVIGQPSYMQAVMKVLDNTPLHTVKAYLKWKSLLLVVNWVDQASSDIAFRFFGTAISGVTESKPLWKRVIQSADGLIIGEAVGREYAKRHFPESSKKAVLDIVEDIRTAYHARLDRIEWMGERTKATAHRKLSSISVLIGYPSHWKDLSKLQFTADNHVQSIFTARRFWTDIELQKVGQSPDAEQWEMNAHTVNAYHHPNRLEIVFPAAILQPPFYNPDASYAANLGGIGAVVGHEFTHGFDDQGADFDEFGNNNRWQTPKERKAFNHLAQHIINQADKYETVPGVMLQGKLILGEAIADIGGLELAIQALRSSVTEQAFAIQVKELLINFARCECGHATTERLIELAKIDPHPPSPFRVNAVVGNVDSFYDAYIVTISDALFIDTNDRARIW